MKIVGYLNLEHKGVYGGIFRKGGGVRVTPTFFNVSFSLVEIRLHIKHLPGSCFKVSVGNCGGYTKVS